MLYWQQLQSVKILPSGSKFLKSYLRNSKKSQKMKISKWNTIFDCAHMAHHFILLWLNPFDLRLDMGMVVWALCVMVAGLLVRRGCAKNVSFHTENGVVWLCHLVVNLYIHNVICIYFYIWVFCCIIRFWSIEWLK